MGQIGANMIDDIQSSKPEIKPKTKLSKIWLLPIVALIIGLGMVYNNWQNQGVQIEVTFDNAEGIIAEKTLVKYLDVDIGIVNEVGFGEQRQSIVVGIEIEKEMRDFLKSDSKFWVVKPRIGTDGISGLSTVLSGVYITISPGNSESFGTQFSGLNQAPVTSPTADGLFISLTSKGGKPPKVGSPVIYRGFEVGKVEATQFDPRTRTAGFGVFINAPYDTLVTTNTYFWNAGGISISATAEGVKLEVTTLETLISGGIQFDVPEELSLGEVVAQSHAFTLYDSWDSVVNRREYDYFEYAILVEDSVSGLYKGAPVEYRGIRIGTVESPFLAFDQPVEGGPAQGEDPRIPVIIRIEPGRVFVGENVDMEAFNTVIQDGILEGLVARIQSANFITGSLKVSLDFVGDPVANMETYGPYPVIPSQRAGLSILSEQLEDILTKVNELPLEDFLQNTDQAIASADTAFGTAQSAFIGIEKSMLEFEAALSGFQPDSQVYDSLDETMIEMQSTLRALQPLINELSNQPNLLIFGGNQPPDIEPTAGGD